MDAPHGRNHIFVRLHLLLLGAAMAWSACGEPRPLASFALSDSLAVLRAVPDVRGRAVCRSDSVETQLARQPVVRCDIGEGVAVTIHGDTIFAVEQSLRPQEPDSGQALLDYWNRHLRQQWEGRLGGRANSISSHNSEQVDRLEAIWDLPTGVRHLVTLERRAGQKLAQRHLAIDCREQDRQKQPIACW